MLNNKCPNCGAPIKAFSGYHSVICDYCGSEIIWKSNLESVSDITKNEELPARQLFDFSNVKKFENEHCQKAAEEMCAWINSGDTVESCLEGLLKLAPKYEKEWAVDTYNMELFHKVRMKLGGSMSCDEKMLFYKDSGVISIGKTGALITDRNIFCIKKNGVEKLPLHEIYSIHALPLIGSGLWYFNSNHTIEIDNMNCSRVEQGIIMALVCLLVQKYKGVGYKIKVYNGVL